MRSPCVVVGAGAAGLTVSAALAEAGVDHLVLERRDVADTWRNQRWDSFRLNTPGWMNTALGTVEPTSFSSRDEVVQLLRQQAADLPVRTQTPVSGLDHDGVDFVVRTSGHQVEAATVVLASGLLNVARKPSLAERVPARMFQIHVKDYRDPARLPVGAVLVVGGAQSGCQVAEDLARSGRRVYLATSRVGRYPWVYRGRELVAWLADCGWWDLKPGDLDDPADTRTAFPVVASGGRDLDLGILSGLGVTLLGRLEDVAGERLAFGGSVHENATYADRVAARLEGIADEYIARQAIEAPARVSDPRAWSLESTNVRELDLTAAGVTSIIWATGFTGDLSWVHLPVFDERGTVLHDGCRSPVPGLCYIGFPWLTRRRSGLFYGVTVDAGEVVEAVVEHLTARRRPGRQDES
jgi:putative flavoprotein involved in K+ transport